MVPGTIKWCQASNFNTHRKSHNRLVIVIIIERIAFLEPYFDHEKLRVYGAMVISILASRCRK